MGKTRYVPESSRVSFILSGLCSEICEAALHSPELPCSRLADIVREAIYQWGLVHMKRERTGGLRLVSADAVACDGRVAAGPVCRIADDLFQDVPDRFACSFADHLANQSRNTLICCASVRV